MNSISPYANTACLYTILPTSSLTLSSSADGDMRYIGKLRLKVLRPSSLRWLRLELATLPANRCRQVVLPVIDVLQPG